MKEIAVVMTMDCEPTTATSHPAATGPRDWEHGERAIRGYWEIAELHGFPVTYFVHPEAAIAQSASFRDLQQRGACLGLHMHPWKYSVWKHGSKRYMAHYGGLSANEQRSLLQEASVLWEEAIGYRPLYFRPGTFSANDTIFAVLDELGFRGGSCSAPGRMMPEMRAIWTGTEPDPHRTSGEFRQVKGDLGFVNVPLSMDFSQLLSGRVGRRMYADLRPDIDWPAQYGVAWKTIARNILTQVLERSPVAPVITVITHNHYEFRDKADPATQRLLDLLDALRQAADEMNIALKGATLDRIVDAVLAAPHVSEAFVCEGAIFESEGQVPVIEIAASV